MKSITKGIHSPKSKVDQEATKHSQTRFAFYRCHTRGSEKRKYKKKSEESSTQEM